MSDHSHPSLLPVTVNADARPIGYFVHHQGRGHAKRCAAIVRWLAPRPVVVFCARPEILPAMGSHVTVIPIADFHNQPAATPALHALPAASGLDCAPVGVRAITSSMSTIARWLGAADPALLVVDVSSEVALLARICSVPVVTIRMHGDRSDQAHTSAYSSSAAILAPFDERLEQADWPALFRARTFYTGGLIDTGAALPSRAMARAALDLPPRQLLIVAMSGGGTGIPLAPLTLGARAFPEALWLSIGRSVRYGHETDFANVRECGWVDCPEQYLAAADVVVINPGDTLVHEVARIGRPLICVPEWCYYDEQLYKSRALAHIKAAVNCERWPGSFSQWQRVVADARQLDVALQRSLANDGAAAGAARWLEELAMQLWQPASSGAPVLSRGAAELDVGLDVDLDMALDV